MSVDCWTARAGRGATLPAARERPSRPPRSPAPHSSRGLGHRPLKAEITGSNPVCGTTSRTTISCGSAHAQSQHLVVLTESHVTEPLCGTKS